MTLSIFSAVLLTLSSTHFKPSVVDSVSKGTVLVENIVSFNSYSEEHDVITFMLKVTNLGNKKIPDLSVSNRSKYVQFYVNGQLNRAMEMSLNNGLEALNGRKTLSRNQSDTFSGGWGLKPDSGLLVQYGNEFIVQWRYRGIFSKKIKVNIKDKLVKILD